MSFPGPLRAMKRLRSSSASMICDQTGYSLGSALTLVNDRSWNGPRLVSNAELTTKVPVNGLRGSQRLRSGRFVGNSYLGITSSLPVTRPEPVASAARAAISHRRASGESARFHFPGERINRDPLNLRRRAKWACHVPNKALEIGRISRNTPLRT